MSVNRNSGNSGSFLLDQSDIVRLSVKNNIYNFFRIGGSDSIQNQESKTQPVTQVMGRVIPDDQWHHFFSTNPPADAFIQTSNESKAQPVSGARTHDTAEGPNVHVLPKEWWISSWFFKALRSGKSPCFKNGKSIGELCISSISTGNHHVYHLFLWAMASVANC